MILELRTRPTLHCVQKSFTLSQGAQLLLSLSKWKQYTLKQITQCKYFIFETRSKDINVPIFLRYLLLSEKVISVVLGIVLRISELTPKTCNFVCMLGCKISAAKNHLFNRHNQFWKQIFYNKQNKTTTTTLIYFFLFF